MITPLFTEAQAAAHLSLCPRTLRKAREAGDLTYVLFGRAIRYTLADLEAFIDSRRTRSTPCTQPSPIKTKAQPRRNCGQVIVPFTARR